MIRHIFVMIGLGLLISFLSVASETPCGAAGFDAGLSIDTVNATGGPGFDLGWGIELGYEFTRIGSWDLGVQGHYLKGFTGDDEVDEDILWGDTDSESMVFESLSLGLTARPHKLPLLFKAGPVHIDYRTVQGEDSGIGFSAGAAIVIGGDSFRLHLLDFEHYEMAGTGFNTLSFSFVFLAAL